MRRLSLNLVLIVTALGNVARGDAVYAPLSTEAAKAAALEWAKARPDYRPEAADVIEPLWKLSDETATSADRFDAVLRTFYLVDPEVRRLVDACTLQNSLHRPTDFPALQIQADSPFATNNIRAFYARFLAITQSYDEALDVFQEIDPSHLVDPAGVLFYKATCEHVLLRREEGLKTIGTLLEDTVNVPLRYATIAGMMRQDLENIKEKSLDEVARQMRDVERRLALGHAGQRVQSVEDRIIATLDELIEKMEDQQQGGGGGGGGGGQGQAQGSPSDGQSGGGQAGALRQPDDINPRPKDKDAGWGTLPEKQQAEVKNMLDKQFPSHYRQAVSEYLRKLAQRPAPSQR